MSRTQIMWHDVSGLAHALLGITFPHYRVSGREAQNLLEVACAALQEDPAPSLSILAPCGALIIKDAEAIFAGDPAAKSLDEVIVAYPGLFAIALHRFSHALWLHGCHMLARVLNEHAHSRTGIDIHPGAKIGHSLCIDHGTGIVIGETAVIGNNVKLYQGVTLGALSVNKDFANTQRHPILEDNVTVYANATILGGETIIGHDSVIGGSVWLTSSVSAHSTLFVEAARYAISKRS